MISVQAVDTKARWHDFVSLPVSVYQGNSSFVSRPFFELKDHLSSKNPYFKNAEAEFFVAYDAAGKAAGRISAQCDNNAEKGTGHFGFIEAEDEHILKLLLERAEAWLKDKGCKKVIGPFSLSINDESGLLVDGFDKRPRLMMAYGQDWYGRVIEDAGYSLAKNLLAYDVNTNVTLPKSARYMARQANQIDGLTERPINMKNFEGDLTEIIEIFNDAWSENWGFIPMSDDDIHYMAKNMRPLIVPDLARIAYIYDRPVAMVVTLPDANEALHGLDGKLLPFGWAKLIWRLKVQGVKTGRILLMGVVKDIDPIRSSAISTLLVQKIQEAALRHKIETIEMSWILEDNEPTKRLITAMGGEVSRTYRLYQKAL